MRSRLRRALCVSLALASTAFACTSFDTEPRPADGGTPEGSSTTPPDGAVLDSARPDAVDGAPLQPLCQTVDARACLDFEPGSIGRGLKSKTTNVDVQLRDGGAQGSMLAQHASTLADGASGYALGASFDVPFTMTMDVQIHALTDTGAATYLLDIASSTGATRVYLDATPTPGATFELQAEVGGTVDGGTTSTRTAVASNLPFDKWITVGATVTTHQIIYIVAGLSPVIVTLDPKLTRFDMGTQLSAGPASAREKFDVLLDNIVVP